jgi:hypothetical protein
MVISRTIWGQSDDDIYIYFFFGTSFCHFSFYCLSEVLCIEFRYHYEYSMGNRPDLLFFDGMH